ncbi:ParA family protein [Vibrio tubiashii]|uniref:ParA family protein n=1 Tax=Vibrio tubiashii TaxID=29498 RepID=UPI001EFC421D|nr:ParA family protein [Vibrio tubiashii]MCG9575374.1 ParA family protein [Vibrio tubiashii]
MDKVQTRAFFRDLKDRASNFMGREKLRYEKNERVFTTPEATAWLGDLDRRTVRSYASKVGISPDTTRYTLSELYRIRDEMRRSDRPLVPERFKRNGLRCQVIAVQNQKGGVGKSTYATSSAAGLATEYPQEYRIGIIDLDPQHNASSYWVENLHLDEHYSAGDLMVRSYELEEGDDEKEFISSCFLPTTIPNLRILPASQTHRSHEHLFHKQQLEGVSDSPYLRLKNIIAMVEDEFDIILIDTPPASGFVTINAYAAATSVVFPVQLNKVDIDATCSYFNFIPDLWDMLETLGHTGFDFLKMVRTNVDENSDSEIEIERKIASEFHSFVFPSSMKSSEAIKVCNNHRSTVFELSKSQYTKSKKSFERSAQNVKHIVSDLHFEIGNVWNSQKVGSE